MNTSLERRLRRALKERRRSRITRERRDGIVWHSSERFVHLQREGEEDPRRGVLLRGACDVPSVFLTAELAAQNLRGVYCIYAGGSGISDARADILLQTLTEIAPEPAREVRQRLGLPADYFQPTLFEPTFTVKGFEKAGPFAKDVVTLSIGPNFGRTAYRHREHGFLVDPGGWWFSQGVGDALGNREVTAWFRKEYESVGRLSLEQFNTDFRELVRQVQARTRARVLVFNFLTIEPGTQHHTYQALRNPQTIRAREMVMSLVDMSRELDFHIVDVDRALKRAGTGEQLDAAHYTSPMQLLIAQECYRLLRELEVL